MRELLSLLGTSRQKNKKEQSWFERDAGDARLAADRQLIAAAYPNLKYGLNFRRHEVFLRGDIVLVEASSGIPTRIATEVRFPDDYPETEPQAFEIGNRFVHEVDRHFYSDTEGCCLWLPPESQWDEKDPAALMNFLDHVTLFYERQLIFDASGGKIWPWGERGHGNNGYLEFFAERLGGIGNARIFEKIVRKKIQLPRRSQCPCGSGRRYKDCHERAVTELQKRF